MKKILSLFLAVCTLIGSIMCLSACSDDNTVTKEWGANTLMELPKNATLFIGAGKRITNTVTERSVEQYLSCVSTVKYSLVRKYKYSGSIPEYTVPVYEGSNYYYYWEVETIEEDVYLGKCNIKTETTYKYLPYADGESILLNTTYVTSYSYDYVSGFREHNISYEIDLNGYFATFEELKAFNQDLALYAYTGDTSNKYFVDAKAYTRTSTESNNYDNTYYYITYYNSESEATAE